MILQMTRPVQAGIRQDRKLEIISNDLANVNSTGYKGDILTFDDMFKARMAVDFSQGDLRETGNPLDLAIAGKGFFKVKTAQGMRYTRDGNFTIDKNRFLVTQNGDQVMGASGPLAITGNNIEISSAGQILADGEIAGSLDIVDFPNVQKMKKQGSSLFAYQGPASDEKSAKDYEVRQGQIESSNVSSVKEMTKMIETHRTFEVYQKVIQTFDDIDSRAISEVGKF